MRFLIIGDPQIDAGNLTSDRTEQTRAMLAWILWVAETQQVDAVVVLGDFGEDVRGVDHYSLTLMVWFAAELRKRAKWVGWLVGNHDFFVADGSINLMSALAPLLEASGHVVAWPWAKGPEGTFLVSYLPAEKMKAFCFRTEVGLMFGENERTVAFSHLPVRGGMFGPGRYDEKGVDPSGMPTTFVGHYHAPNPPSMQDFIAGKGIFYCGCPMSHDFRDNVYGLAPHQQRRGVWIAEIVNGVVPAYPTFIENPHAHYFLSFTSEVDSAGVPVDRWFREQCVVPLERTKIRLSVPSGAAPAIAAQSVALVPPATNVSAQVASRVAIDPNASERDSVAAYVHALPDDALRGLDRGRVLEAGLRFLPGAST